MITLQNNSLASLFIEVKSQSVDQYSRVVITYNPAMGFYMAEIGNDLVHVDEAKEVICKIDMIAINDLEIPTDLNNKNAATVLGFTHLQNIQNIIV